jgi:hypothetical protein
MVKQMDEAAWWLIHLATIGFPAGMTMSSLPIEDSVPNLPMQSSISENPQVLEDMV